MPKKKNFFTKKNSYIRFKFYKKQYEIVKLIVNKVEIGVFKKVKGLYRLVSAHSRLRPYHTEHTPSRPIWEVKQCRARLVLRWVTAWEYRVP